MFAYYGPEWESLESRMVDRWCTSFSGNTGLQLPSTMGRNHGTLTNFSNNGNDAYVSSPDRLALNFDGVNDRVECGAIGSFLGDCTWSCWFRHTATGADQCLMTTRNILTGAARNGVAIYLRGAGLPTVEAEFVIGGTRYTATINGSTANGRWYLAVARRVRGTCFLDVPGLGLASSASSSTATITHEVGPTFGLWRDYSLEAFSVQLDDITIFNAALTSNEIRFIYEQGRGGGMLYQPPRRRSYFVAPVSGWKPYWIRPSSKLIGTGI